MSVSRASSRTYLRLSILSALGLLAVNTAMAAISENASINDSNLPQVELDEIVVTATRTPTKTSNVIAQTRVINKEELQRYQGQTVLDVLKRQPGIAFKQNGGLGASSNFYMRGYDSKQVLVLIDGIRYSSVSAGGAALNLLPADQIDRIEVLYGASGSSIYGADAMGGVIQVFTKGSNIDRSSMSVTAGIGSNDHYVYGASAQLANTNGTTLSLSASHNETDGINATRPDPSNQNDPYNKDADGFESDSVSLAVNQRFGDTLLTGASILYSKSTTEYDDGIFEDVHADQENGAAQAYVDWQYMPDASVKLQYGHSVDKSESYAKYPNVFDGTQDQISLVGKNKLLAGEAVYGLEYLTQDLDSTAYSIDDRNVKSAFAGYVVANDRFDAQANLRYDDDSRYGDETTYNLGGAMHLSPNFRVGASYAKGFRAPVFNDLSPAYGGDLNLNPETSDNYEVFAQYDSTRHSTRLTGYRSDVDNLIAYSNFKAKNINSAKIEGISLTSDWEMNDYLFGGSYDYQKAKDNSGGSDDGNYLPYRPKHQGLVYVGYRLPSLDIRAEYQYVGNYYSRITNTDAQFVDNYGLLNISGNYKLTDNLSMTARLNNITNEDYITDIGYNTDGINYFTSLTYNWY
ncbi:Outer membrane vitamin B12 receptor BtuB [Psychrobacter nivimaris]|mgnify:FL=1|uniref:Outer membrane vitamin B12 receptor BtuB n=1 Tax=Psychrobacter nivimaris TaxID=281738 RepID=A0A6N7BYX0_9GAMM|nr:TonB-dependent receptor [Psychrobacter nivimaris]KAF0568262.1 Outer membrane vitamin B12 receptor BtuB [Psychrobacter nivimaris]